MKLKPPAKSQAIHALSSTLKASLIAGACLLPLTSHSSVVKLGMSTALSGPASALGQGVKLGVEIAFQEANGNGGIHGNTLSLKVLDDGYEPAKAGPNMHSLAEEKEILAVIGNVGTPTAIVSVPIANETKIPLIGAFTGAGVLRQTPPDRYIVNYRASYAEETAAMIDGLMASGIKPEEIAFFTQNDGYGNAGFSGATKALAAKGFTKMDSLVHSRYERNTVNIEAAAEEILSTEIEPKAIIMVGAYNPSAEFIKLVKDELPDVYFVNISFVGSAALKGALGETAEGIIVTQVVPHFDSKTPGAEAYRTAMKKYAPDATPGFVSFEGYLAARTLIGGLENADENVTRETLIDGLEKLSEFDLGIGPKVTINSSTHQASHKVWPTIVKNGKFIPMDWSDL